MAVNKSDETIDIYKRICAYNNKINIKHQVYLLGSVDGVGFSENPNGTIVKMLDAFDGFFQMHTLFKIPVFLQKIGMINNIKEYPLILTILMIMPFDILSILSHTSRYSKYDRSIPYPALNS